jgi:hypothetical protein
MRLLVGAVGIELKATLKLHTLLILQHAKPAQTCKIAKAGYTAGTRRLEDPIEVERFLLVSP